MGVGMGVALWRATKAVGKVVTRRFQALVAALGMPDTNNMPTQFKLLSMLIMKTRGFRISS